MAFHSGNYPLPIYFENSVTYTTTNIIGHYFPGLLWEAEHRNYIDAQDLADKLCSALYDSFHVRMKTVRAALKPLFGLVQAHNADRGMAAQIMKLLNKFLELDLRHPSHSGLSRSRTRFLILAFVAQETKSTQLANGLVSFFYENTQEILTYEPSELLQEWGSATVELRGLIMEQSFQECMYRLARKGHKMVSAYNSSGLRDPRFEQLINLLTEVLDRSTMYDFDRGRRNHRNLMYETPRSATIPRMHHPRHLSRPRTPLFLPAPDSLIMNGLDPMTAMMAPPPLVSPGLLAPLGAPFGGPVDDVDVLALRQAQLEDQVRELQTFAGLT
ncbi:hypothetical protein K505DRAFT_361979 [Melanomma pulvis-pyrius CBS 109.77]|uniref:Uncharacterized protein n=1 Tax=Melanomma pulvis-pyrius CBS 109.77 TaxID=1314802 RepID=A0A6A6XC21_9PLEO|nr:hypothetical protein K505DRAFT_361979 [Melanomma pulvis-pyrius CBS 109.77]